MDGLTKDLQKMILDKVQNINTMTLAFYTEFCRCGSRLIFYVKRNRNDPQYHFTLYDYNSDNKLETVLIRNEKSLRTFLKTFVLDNVYINNEDTQEEMVVCYKDEDFDVPRTLNWTATIPYSYSKQFWGLSRIINFEGEDILDQVIECVVENIEGLIAFA